MAASGRRGRRRGADSKLMGVAGWLTMILLGVPIAAAFTLMAGAAVATTVVWSLQAQLGWTSAGTITDTASHTVRSRRGPDETYCYGLLRPAEGGPEIRVRVYVDDSCSSAQEVTAPFVPAVGRAVSEAIVPPERVGGPMAFNGLYGMAPGAIVDSDAFVRGLWPFLFILPCAVGADVLVVGIIRADLRARRSRRAR